MSKVVLIVLGLGGSSNSLDALIERYSKFERRIIEYWQYPVKEQYYLYVGHSMGAIVIQNDLRIPAYKIHVYGMIAYRGKQKQAFFEGHPVT